MPPEISEKKPYNGKSADVFTAGVILFVLVNGIFPFNNATTDDHFYKLLLEGKYEQYWQQTGGQNLSDDFKDLFIRMVSYNPALRPTVEEIRQHPWMQK